MLTLSFSLLIFHILVLFSLLRLFILHFSLCKVIDKVMSRTLEWIARDRPIDISYRGV